MARAKKTIADRGEKGAGPADYGVILAPVITEKSSLMGGGGNVLVFKVAGAAKKKEIKEAVERVFKVNVVAVRTCNFLGKMKRTAKGQSRRSGYRKAYITLKEGQTVDIVEGL